MKFRPVAHMRISHENGGLYCRAVDGGAVNFLACLKVSRGRNLRKDAGDIEESNLDRSSKEPQLGTRYEITVGVRFLVLFGTVL